VGEKKKIKMTKKNGDNKGQEEKLKKTTTKGMKNK